MKDDDCKQGSEGEQMLHWEISNAGGHGWLARAERLGARGLMHTPLQCRAASEVEAGEVLAGLGNRSTICRSLLESELTSVLRWCKGAKVVSEGMVEVVVHMHMYTHKSHGSVVAARHGGEGRERKSEVI